MKSVLALLLVAGLAGCATAPNGQVVMSDQGRTALGTATGAALGAHFGNRISEGSPTGTAIGAIAGGAVGNALTQPSYPSNFQQQPAYVGPQQPVYGPPPQRYCRGRRCWY